VSSVSDWSRDADRAVNHFPTHPDEPCLHEPDRDWVDVEPPDEPPTAAAVWERVVADLKATWKRDVTRVLQFSAGLVACIAVALVLSGRW